MQICRFNENRLGVVRDNRVYDVSGVLDRLPVFRYPLPEHDPLIAALPELRPIIESMLAGARSVDLASVRLLPPVASPRKIVAAPVNYRKHIEEARSDAAIHHHQAILDIDRAGLFLKATSSLIGPSDPLMIRHADRRNDHEIELVAVIGKTVDRVTPEKALDCVAGYCVGLDMTVRGTEERSLRKSVDTFSVIGPWMVTADDIADPGQLVLELRVNGDLRQQASTADLLRDLPSLIALASSFYTLRPGDLLFTGTPEGVGAVKSDDSIAAWIEGIGTMQVAVH